MTSGLTDFSCQLVLQSSMPLRSGLADDMPPQMNTDLARPVGLTECHATEKWSYRQHVATSGLTDFSCQPALQRSMPLRSGLTDSMQH